MSQLAIIFSGLGVATLDIMKKENCHQETDTYPEVDTRAEILSRCVIAGSNPTCDVDSHIHMV